MFSNRVIITQRVKDGNADNAGLALRNAPAAYQLAPGAQYDLAVGSAVEFRYDADNNGQIDGNLPYARWQAIVRQERNPGLADSNLNFHNAYDLTMPLDSNVQVVRVVGINILTVGKIIVNRRNCNNQGCIFEYSEGMVKGDATVPQSSAALCNFDLGYDKRGRIPNKLFNEVEHAALATNPDVLNFVVDYLRGRIGVPLSATCEIPRSTAADVVHAVGLEVHGPIQAEITDAHNQAFRPAQGAVDPASAIPGLHYGSFPLGPSQSFYLQGQDSYIATLQVTGVRTMRLRVNTFTDWERQTSATFDLSEGEAPVGTRLMIRFATIHDPSTLRLEIDRDADGIIDVVVAPSVIETTQP